MTAPLRPPGRDYSDALDLLLTYAKMPMDEARGVIDYLLSEGHPIGVITLTAFSVRKSLADYYAADGPMRIGGFLRGGCVRQKLRLIEDLTESGDIG